MDHAEELKHLRTLINVASEADDLEQVYKILREMRGVIDNAMPPKPATPTSAASSRPAGPS